MEENHPTNLPVYPLGLDTVAPPCFCNKEGGSFKLHLERDLVPTNTGGGPWLLVQGLVDTLVLPPSSESWLGSCSSSEESS